MIYTTSKIAEVFQKYYSTLYNYWFSGYRNNKIKKIKIQEYIKAAGLPVLPAENVKTLKEPITKEEIEMAIRTTKSGKSPGLDGFTIIYYNSLKIY